MLLREIFLEGLGFDHTGLSRRDWLAALVQFPSLREKVAINFLKTSCSKEELETIIRLVSNQVIVEMAARQFLTKNLNDRELKVISMLVPSLRAQVEEYQAQRKMKEKIFKAISTRFEG